MSITWIYVISCAHLSGWPAVLGGKNFNVDITCKLLYQIFGLAGLENNGHICKTLTKGGEPWRYSWERRRRRSTTCNTHSSEGEQKHMEIGSVCPVHNCEHLNINKTVLQTSDLYFDVTLSLAISM